MGGGGVVDWENDVVCGPCCENPAGVGTVLFASQKASCQGCKAGKEYPLGMLNSTSYAYTI